MYGQDANVGICFQDSYGTSQVSSIYFLQHLSESLKTEIPPLKDESMRGVYDEGDTYAGAKKAGGDIDTIAASIELGVLLRGLMGSPSTVTSGGVYTHTFKPRQSDWDINCANDPLTAYRYLNTGSADLFANCAISALELGISQGELLKAKATLVGGTLEQITNVAATYPVGKKFEWDVASVSVGGAANTDITELTITIDDQLEAQHTLNGSKWPSRIKRNGMRTVAIGGTLKFENQTEYQNFLNQAEQALIINFKGTTEIQSGYYEEVRITIPNLRYSDLPPNAGGPGQIEVSITADAKYNVNSATALAITLVNSQAAF